MSVVNQPEMDTENTPIIENQQVGKTEEGVFRVPSVPKDTHEIEKEQEAKLKAKYGMIKKPGGGSSLLQKRLQKGNKYFDSGDYNMAKAKMNNPKRPLAPKDKLLLQESIGGAIPTPTEVDNIRRPSQVASKLLLPGQEQGDVPEEQ